MNTLKLKLKRLEKNLTQKCTAKAIGTSTKTYCLKEGGKSEFDRTEIVSLIILLNLSDEDVMEIFFNDEITKRQLNAAK